MRRSIIYIVVATSSMLSGCASTWNVGDSKYGCPGLPAGVVCKTPLEVYKLTNSRNALVTMDANGNKAVLDGGQGKPTPAVQMLNVHLPTPISQPMPVMEAAQVMRIWVAPWIDQAGDLHYPSYIYTEVTRRRWSLGSIAKGQTAAVPVSAYIDADRDDPSAPKGNLLPMAPAGVAPPQPVQKSREDVPWRPGGSPPATHAANGLKSR